MKLTVSSGGVYLPQLFDTMEAAIKAASSQYGAYVPFDVQEVMEADKESTVYQFVSEAQRLIVIK